MLIRLHTDSAPDAVNDSVPTEPPAVEQLGRSWRLVHLGAGVASWGVHRLDVFAQAAGQTMLHQTYDGKFWYPADDLGPAIVGSPGAVAWGPDRLDVFVRGTDNQLWQMAYTGGSWVGYYPLGGSLTSSPAVASWGRTGSMSFMRGDDNALYHVWWNGFGWSPYERLGGNLKALRQPFREARI
jgi:hypothetical protein